MEFAVGEQEGAGVIGQSDARATPRASVLSWSSVATIDGSGLTGPPAPVGRRSGSAGQESASGRPERTLVSGWCGAWRCRANCHRSPPRCRTGSASKARPAGCLIAVASRFRVNLPPSFRVVNVVVAVVEENADLSGGIGRGRSSVGAMLRSASPGFLPVAARGRRFGNQAVARPRASGRRNSSIWAPLTAYST